MIYYHSNPPRAGHYKCLVVDPPWDQGKTGKRSVRPNQGTALPYPTMTCKEIASLPINAWAADHAFLWLWATNSRSHSSGKPILLQAFELMENWGFRYYTTITWNKTTGPCPFGPYQIISEHCLFGYRGKCVFPKESLGKMQTVFSASVKRHSEKPTRMYNDIRRHFHAPRLDVFARKRHPGFDAWGNQREDSCAFILNLPIQYLLKLNPSLLTLENGMPRNNITASITRTSLCNYLNVAFFLD